MEDLGRAWTALRFVGVMMYPLLFLGMLSLIILLDKAFVYWRYARPPGVLFTLADTHGFDWPALDQQLAKLGPGNYFGRFSRVIIDHRDKPVWWVESRAGEEAKQIEKALSRGLWLLETVVTAAPLLGLLGTIAGMMDAFRVISGNGLVEPARITGGVAQALIATALGISIAVVALFIFNFFSRLQSNTLDEMERLGTRLMEHVRLDQPEKEAPGEVA
ncbi:MAG TPA: MotA/TolQ/ExbB proton channel family protein [Nitrospiria bacterium]|nr:MotA/TolQ/ExbB proton channel family protein [Nitrospiria bacterium]